MFITVFTILIARGMVMLMIEISVFFVSDQIGITFCFFIITAANPSRSILQFLIKDELVPIEYQFWVFGARNHVDYV